MEFLFFKHHNENKNFKKFTNFSEDIIKNKEIPKNILHISIDKTLGEVRKILKKLKNKEEYLEYKNEFWETPLLLAAKNKRLDLVLLFIKEKANIYVEDNSGKNLLYYSIKYDYKKGIKKLINKFDINKTFNWALEFNNFDLIKKLIKKVNINKIDFRKIKDFKIAAFFLNIQSFQMK